MARLNVNPTRMELTALKKKLDAFLENGGKLLATGKSGLYADQYTASRMPRRSTVHWEPICSHSSRAYPSVSSHC